MVLGGKKESETPPFSLFGVHKKLKLNNHNLQLEDWAPNLAGTLIVCSVSVCPYEFCLVGSVGQVLLVSLTLLTPTILSLCLPGGSPTLSNVDLCNCSNQLPDEASMIITGLGTNLWVLQNIIRNHVIDFKSSSSLLIIMQVLLRFYIWNTKIPTF